MLIFGAILGVTEPVLTMAAAMGFRSPFMAPIDKREEADKVRKCEEGCSLTSVSTGVLLLWKVFSYDRMYSLSIECTLLLLIRARRPIGCAYGCSLTTERVLLLYNVFSYYRMCSLTIECVLLLQVRQAMGLMH